MATKTAGSDSVATDSYVVARSKEGGELRAALLRLAPYKAVFELFQVPPDLRVSQALDSFKILVADKPIYEGRAVISSLVGLGTGLVCEATLEDAWVDPTAQVSVIRETGARVAFETFLKQWQRSYRIHPEFKAVVADMQTFLTDLRMWLDQVELGTTVRAGQTGGMKSEELAAQLSPHTLPIITRLFENYERALQGVDPDCLPVYQNFSKRQLHRLLLCSPFLHRTYSKPLGYAGDYEMVNMICRNPYEGNSLYAMLVNHWFIQQPPAEAHRNRIQFLTERLIETALAGRRLNRPVHIITIGCGPAQEIQRFIIESELSDHAIVRLVDFNEETANYTLNLLTALKRRHQRQIQLEMVRKSVHQILKEGRGVARAKAEPFDFVYCAGLFDYLTDQTCHRLTNILYEQVSPGGLFVSTNVDVYNPRRPTMDSLMDWHLIYRNGEQLAALRPDGVSPEHEAVSADATGVNVYYTLRKPE